VGLPRIEQKFGGEWLTVPIRIAAAGDSCEVIYGIAVRFSLSSVTRVMVSTRRGFLKHKDARTIHFLGHAGEVASLKTVRRPAHTQAAATFIRHLIQEWRQSERERIREATRAERERNLESRRAERERLLETKRAEREKDDVRRTSSPAAATKTVTISAMRPNESQGKQGVPLSNAAMEEFERSLGRIRFRARRDEQTVRAPSRRESQSPRGSAPTDSDMLELERARDRIKIVDRRHGEEIGSRDFVLTDAKRKRPRPSVNAEELELEREHNPIKGVDRRRRD
jgi:hypothetical protein